MRKFILGLAATAVVAAVGVIGTAGAATADVPRCDAPVTSTTKATFTAWEPASVENQWADVWRHDYTITVNPDGSFTGTGAQNGDDIYGAVFHNEPETINGTIGAGNTISYTANRPVDDRTWTLTNAPTTPGMTDPNVGGTSVETTNTPTVKFKIATPAFEVTDAMNHGQYVSGQGGGKTAAHACAGMPLQSNKIKG